jgi:hypothetical protein
VKNAFAVLFVLVAAACGDNGNNQPPADSPTTPGDGSNTPGDGSNVPAATLTSYVMDLVVNHTTTPEEARAYDEFKALPDPDGDANNGSAYSSLFQ